MDGGPHGVPSTISLRRELYQIDVDNRFPYWVYAGQQDNTTIAVRAWPPEYRPGGAESYWEAIGDVKPGLPCRTLRIQMWFTVTVRGRFGVYSRTTGQEQHYYVGGV